VSHPNVSVVLPFHNADEYLADALESVRVQTLREFECLLVDDASTDASLAIAERFVDSDARFKLQSNRERLGVSASRNAALAAAKGRWLTFLDADDLYIPDRLDRLTSVGEAQGAELVFDDQIVTEYPESRSRNRAFGFRRECFGFTQEDFFAQSRLFRRSFPVGYMKPLVLREFLRTSGAAYDPEVVSGEDFLFYAQLFARRPKAIAVNYAGYVYRRRHGSVSRSDERLHFQAGLSARLLTRVDADLSEESRSALVGRKRDFDAIADVMPAISAWRDRRWIGVARAMAMRPSIVSTTFRLLRTRLIRKLSACRY
jgi:glycosyltransferase involved in cell wall biosynthesis